MADLFTRDGTCVTRSPARFPDFREKIVPEGWAWHGHKAYEIQYTDKGLPFIEIPRPCDHCSVVNGERIWCRGIENGRPYSRTGFECWKCGNSGFHGTDKLRLYTAERLAVLNKAQATREATQARKADEKRQQELAAWAAWADANRDVVEFLAKFAEWKPEYGASEFQAGLYTKANRLAQKIQISEAEVGFVRKVIASRNARDEKAAASQWIGQIGDRIEVTVTNVRTIDVSFGGWPRVNRYIVVLETDDGQTLKYVGDSNAVPYRNGDSWAIKATVAGHEEYQGTRQTVIQRPKAIEQKEAA